MKDYWTRAQAARSAATTITDATGQPFKSADSFWKHVLHDGWVPGTARRPEVGGRRLGTLPLPAPWLRLQRCRRRCPEPDLQPPTSDLRSGGSGDHLPARPHDLGRPLRQQRLAAGAAEAADQDHVGPDRVGQREARGASRSSRDGDVIELQYRGNTAKLPVTIVPGHPDGAVTAFFGYGRQHDRTRRHVGRRDGEGVQRLPAAHLRRAVVRQRPRDREDRRALRASRARRNTT